jgi:hypothetical protein
MKQFTPLLLMLCLAIQISAQDKEQTETTNVTRLSLFNPGFSYEHKTGKNQTLFVNPFVAIMTGFSYSDAFGFRVLFDIDPILITHYRFYYNGLRRAEKGKRTAMNSMNYLAPMAQLKIPKRAQFNETGVEFKRQVDFAFGALWGMQRNYGRRLSIDLNAGPGCYFWKNVNFESGRKITDWKAELSPAFQFTLGFWLNKK